MKFGPIILFFSNILFAVLACTLASALWHVKKQEAHMLSRIEVLTERQKHLCDEFALKQDYMRQMISSDEFVEQIIREKIGLSKQNEVIFKFED
ncbi:MAG: septum formation initiator family protein [Puniceicoccales bacterium]|jgi:cell division protein FtsB|nr:septum formation initiator family protein [Puniceicoccales bacterium]